MSNAYINDNYDQYDSDYKGPVYAVTGVSGAATEGQDGTHVWLSDSPLDVTGCPYISEGSIAVSIHQDPLLILGKAGVTASNGVTVTGGAALTADTGGVKRCK